MTSIVIITCLHKIYFQFQYLSCDLLHITFTAWYTIRMRDFRKRFFQVVQKVNLFLIFFCCFLKEKYFYGHKKENFLHIILGTVGDVNFVKSIFLKNLNIFHEWTKKNILKNATDALGTSISFMHQT